MKEVSIRKSGPLAGEVVLPGDKSISHRSVILASIADGSSEIKNYLDAEDCMSTLHAMRSLGVEIQADGSSVLVKGAGMEGLKEPDDVIDAGNSGTTIRLLSGFLSGQPFFTVMTGDEYLRKRPMRRVVEPLSKMGANIWGRDGGDKAPLAICGRKLNGIDYSSPIASAQVKSSLLLAGLGADGKTVVSEPTLSRDHTERMLSAMGAKAGRVDDRSFYVEGGYPLNSFDIEVPGDISSAAFFMAAALVVDGSEVMLKGVGVNPTRTGVIDIFRDMGGDIRLENVRDVVGEPVADIVVRSSSLKGIEIGGDIIPRAIDEIPVIAVAAALAEGTTTIKGASELRVKESDRIKSISSELQKLGANVTELDDGMIIEGRDCLKGGRVSSYGDHRVAMSMAVAGLMAEGETVIDGAESIDISFPGFFDIIKGLNK